MEYMQGEISNRERFRDVNNQRRMEKIHKYVNDLTSFDEGLILFPSYEETFQVEDLRKLRKGCEKKTKNEKKKKEQLKEMDARDDG